VLSIEEVIERVKDILSKEFGERKIYDKDVAKALGITPEHLSMLKRRRKLPLPELLDFCASRKININWLLYDQDPHSLCEETQKFVYVRYFKDIGASAGGGAINYESEEERLYIDEKVAQMLGARSRLKYIEAINVIGDSMEPLLRDGSIVFVDRSMRDINRGGIFLIATEAGVFIKRVRLRVDGKIELISQNPNYSTEVVEPENIQIIGKVIGSVEKI